MMKVQGVIIFLISYLGVYWAGKRKFKRTNEAGVEEFKSYGRAIAASVIEGIVRIIGRLGIVSGLIVFLVGWKMKS
jgi:hypothetical protein